MQRNNHNTNIPESDMTSTSSSHIQLLKDLGIYEGTDEFLMLEDIAKEIVKEQISKSDLNKITLTELYERYVQAEYFKQHEEYLKQHKDLKDLIVNNQNDLLEKAHRNISKSMEVLIKKLATFMVQTGKKEINENDLLEIFKKSDLVLVAKSLLESSGLIQKNNTAYQFKSDKLQAYFLSKLIYDQFKNSDMLSNTQMTQHIEIKIGNNKKNDNSTENLIQSKKQKVDQREEINNTSKAQEFKLKSNLKNPSIKQTSKKSVKWMETVSDKEKQTKSIPKKSISISEIDQKSQDLVDLIYLDYTNGIFQRANDNLTEPDNPLDSPYTFRPNPLIYPGIKEIVKQMTTNINTAALEKFLHQIDFQDLKYLWSSYQNVMQQSLDKPGQDPISSDISGRISKVNDIFRTIIKQNENEVKNLQIARDLFRIINDEESNLNLVTKKSTKHPVKQKLKADINQLMLQIKKLDQQQPAISAEDKTNKLKTLIDLQGKLLETFAKLYTESDKVQLFGKSKTAQSIEVIFKSFKQMSPLVDLPPLVSNKKKFANPFTVFKRTQPIESSKKDEAKKDTPVYNNLKK